MVRDVVSLGVVTFKPGITRLGLSFTPLLLPARSHMFAFYSSIRPVALNKLNPAFPSMPSLKWTFPKSPNVYYAREVYGKHRLKLGKLG